ncbi:MAG: nucleotidyltransferase family protein [Alphaproteobacteria bacterium]|nr:nucleotidyltransferase family protein [Alphaproteobacteria bacterium]
MTHADITLDLLRWAATRDQGLAAALRPRLNDPGLQEFLIGREVDSLAHLVSGTISGRQRVYDQVLAHQAEALQEVMEVFLKAGIRTVTFKGSELVPRNYDGHSLGLIADCDVLIPRDRIEEARAAMYGLGFRHAIFVAEAGGLVSLDVADIAGIEIQHYELAPFRKAIEIDPDEAVLKVLAHGDVGPLHWAGDRVILVLEIDVHHNVASDADVEMLFDRAVPREGGPGETLSPADHVWLNLSRYYNEVALHNKTSLRPIAYTLPEISSGKVDWDVVSEAVEALKLGPTLYYFLAFCDAITGGMVPPAILEQTHPLRTNRIRDWGWQVGKLLDSVDPAPVDMAMPLDKALAG